MLKQISSALNQGFKISINDHHYDIKPLNMIQKVFPSHEQRYFRATRAYRNAVSKFMVDIKPMFDCDEKTIIEKYCILVNSNLPFQDKYIKIEPHSNIVFRSTLRYSASLTGIVSILAYNDMQPPIWLFALTIPMWIGFKIVVLDEDDDYIGFIPIHNLFNKVIKDLKTRNPTADFKTYLNAETKKYGGLD